MAGVTPEGFERDSLQTVIERVNTKLRSRIDPSLDLGPETPEGQFIGALVDEIDLGWAALEAAYNGFDPDKAEDNQLVSLAKLTGTPKLGATKSRIVATVNLTAGTTLLAGVNFAHVFEKPLVRFTPVADFTAPTTGNHSVPFEAEQAGPILVGEASLTVIATTVVGWNSITNAADAVPGTNADSNETLRARRESQLGASGNATIDAIIAKVGKVPGVLSCDAFENDTHWVDVNGLPPHSVEVLVFDGASETVDNDTIAQAIWDARGGGIQYFGSSSGVAKDSRNRDRTVYFSRIQELPIYVGIDLTKATSGYVGDAPLELHFVTEANKLQRLGTTVKVRQIDSLVYGLAGVIDVTGFRIGTAPSPVGTGNVAVGARQIPRFDTSRTTVSSSV